jgi:ankyrin repeat protein
VNNRNEYQSSSLHLAAIEGHVEVCRILIEAGAAAAVVAKNEMPRRETPKNTRKKIEKNI